MNKASRYQKHKEEILDYQRWKRNQNRELNKNGGIEDTRELKKCIICKRFLPLSFFNRNILRWDGLEAYCRECNVIKARRWREKNRKRVNELVYTSNARYPDRVNARSLAHFHYPKRQMCSIIDCGELGERHHPDYANGKDIIWLCKKHHNLLYHNNRRIVEPSVV